MSDPGRPVPPHGSGGGYVVIRGERRNDPDETPGRALYRALANREAREALARTRKVRLMSSTARIGDRP